jgi:hypothetical protein
MAPHARMMIGKGTSRKKMATNAAAAIEIIVRFLRDRLPMRNTASTTTATTAGLRP